jgi:hypothetical protein
MERDSRPRSRPFECYVVSVVENSGTSSLEKSLVPLDFLQGTVKIGQARSECAECKFVQQRFSLALLLVSIPEQYVVLRLSMK